MTSSKWANANLEPMPGHELFHGLAGAKRYRGLVLYTAYDYELGCCAGDEWELRSGLTGHVVMTIWAYEERALLVATKVAEMLDWGRIGEARWLATSSDPAFLAFMAEHLHEVSIPVPEDELDAIVPYAALPTDEVRATEQ